MQYIIDINPIEGTNLYKAEGFNTLVFDKIGLEKLKPLTAHSSGLKAGDIFRTPKGTTEYEFVGYSQTGKINCVNISNGNYTCLAMVIMWLCIVCMTN